jgi:Holliday junction resolvase RusA-like endonuclease
MTARLIIGFVVLGGIATQGSINAFPIMKGSKAKGTQEFTGKIAMVSADAKLPVWREAVRKAARASVGQYADLAEFPYRGPLSVEITFSVNRPKRVPPERCGWPSVKPDLDKYERAILDALTISGVIIDDGQFVQTHPTKIYNVLPAPGVIVEVYALDEVEEAEARSRVESGQAYRKFMAEIA